VLDNGVELAARSVVIATGAQYNKPRIANLAIFEGQGIYYGATFMEAQLCGDDDIIVVGGGNSAGQAAVYMSQTQRKVHSAPRQSKLVEHVNCIVTPRDIETRTEHRSCK
jgi:thioredoxin reductase (NADPH)